MIIYDKNKLTKEKFKTNKTKMPYLKYIKKTLKEMTEEQFITKITNLINSENVNELNSFFYFIILNRDLENVQNCLNSKDFPAKYLEKLFMFTFGHCAMHGYTTESILDTMLYFLSEESILKLLQESTLLRRDKLLMFYLLAKLDIDYLNTYFNKKEYLIDVISVFYKLPEEDLKTIIVRNHKLLEYIIMVLVVDSTSNEDDEIIMFMNKYKGIIDEFSSMVEIIMKYHSEVDLSTEKNLPFNKRNMKRISFLVNTLRSMPNREKAIEYFAEERVFVDEYERQVIEAFVSDPLLKDTFHQHNI